MSENATVVNKDLKEFYHIYDWGRHQQKYQINKYLIKEFKSMAKHLIKLI